MIRSEALTFDRRQADQLQKEVRRGEGAGLEFKRKVAYPEKVICEITAFANTEGGVLLIGVDDDGSIPGVKYPEEEILVLTRSLQQHCRPAFSYSESIIPISEKRFVVRFEVPVSPRRPHYVIDKDQKFCYVRVADKTIKASREVAEIVARARKKKDIKFSFGDAEKVLMQYLEQNGTITVQKFQSVAKLSRFLASRKLILLVLANVLRITPTEKEDSYSRI